MDIKWEFSSDLRITAKATDHRLPNYRDKIPALPNSRVAMKIK